VSLDRLALCRLFTAEHFHLGVGQHRHDGAVGEQRVDLRHLLEDLRDAIVKSGQAREATVWLAWRPGDLEPRWVEIQTTPLVANSSAIARDSVRN
jgi:hypothetical protein